MNIADISTVSITPCRVVVAGILPPTVSGGRAVRTGEIAGAVRAKRNTVTLRRHETWEDDSMSTTCDWGVGRYEETAARLEPAARTVVERAAPRGGDRVAD